MPAILPGNQAKCRRIAGFFASIAETLDLRWGRCAFILLRRGMTDLPFVVPPALPGRFLPELGRSPGAAIFFAPIPGHYRDRDAGDFIMAGRIALFVGCVAGLLCSVPAWAQDRAPAACGAPAATLPVAGSLHPFAAVPTSDDCTI